MSTPWKAEERQVVHLLASRRYRAYSGRHPWRVFKRAGVGIGYPFLGLCSTVQLDEGPIYDGEPDAGLDDARGRV